MLDHAAVAYMRCKVTEAKELSTHTAVFCEVVDAWQGTGGDPLIYGDYQKDMKSKTMAAFKAFKETGSVPAAEKKEKWVCRICGYVYDGDIPFEELPDVWTCPLCMAPKSEFVKE